MRTFYIHAGHGKTGTSRLQSVFACSVVELRRAGILYPAPAKHIGVAAEGRITSGNGVGWLKNETTLAEKLSGVSETSQDSLLISSEFIFDDIIEWGERDSDAHAKLYDAATKCGFSRISILLFIRNPVEYAFSHWQQYVKRGNEIATITDFLKNSDLNRAKLLSGFFEVVQQIPCTTVRVRNYSKVRVNLLHEASGWLGVPIDLFSLPSRENVNRSLSLSELELQRQLNAEVSGTHPILSDKFCEELPDILSENPHVPREEQISYWHRFSKDIERANALLPLDQRYIFEEVTGTHSNDVYPFNSQQLGIISGAIAGEIRKKVAAVEQTRGAHLQRDAAIAQRDQAIAERDGAIAERDGAIAERDATLALLRTAISRKRKVVARLRFVNRHPASFIWSRLKGRFSTAVRRLHWRSVLTTDTRSNVH